MELTGKANLEGSTQISSQRGKRCKPCGPHKNGNFEGVAIGNIIGRQGKKQSCIVLLDGQNERLKLVSGVAYCG